MVPPSGSDVKFLPYPSGKCLTSPLQSTLSVSIYWVLPNITYWRGCSTLCFNTKGDNIVESKVKGLAGLGVLVTTTMPLFCVIGVLNGLVKPLVWDLINFRNESYLSPSNIDLSIPRRTKDLIEDLPH